MNNVVVVEQKDLMEVFALSKYRLKFVKDEAVKFVPHLDTLRLYQRAVRRANVPIKYSQGFNPHQHMSIAQPLSVGMIGKGEYLDLETTEQVNIEELISSINECLPEGTYVIAARELKDGEKNAMASVEGGSYEIYLDFDMSKEELQNNIDRFLVQEMLIVTKQAKSKVKGRKKDIIKEVDIKSDIYEMRAVENKNGKSGFYTLISTGSVKNLKPDLLVECFCEFLGEEFSPYKIIYERQELFKIKDGKFISLFD